MIYKVKNQPLILAALLSFCFHGALAIFLIPSFPKGPLQKVASFEVAWLKPTSCDPRAGDLERAPQKKKAVEIKRALPFAKASSVSPRPCVPRLREDGANKRGHQKIKALHPPSQARLHQPLPTYPWVCRKRHQEGVVYLHVTTDAKGRVITVSLCKSSGHTLLDKAALEAVQSWSFHERHLQKTLSIAFRLQGEEVSLS
jgi:TonB family protein